MGRENIGIEERNRWFQKYIWALHIVTECIENYLKKICDYSKTGKTFYLCRHIMEGYKGEDRRIILCTDKNAENYLTEEQYYTLFTVWDCGRAFGRKYKRG